MIHQTDQTSELGLAPVATAIAWIGCVIVGVAGTWVVAPPHRAALAKTPPPVQATLIHVDMSRRAAPTHSAPPAPLPPAPSGPPPAPPIAAVAAPSPTIAFALPTTGPVKLVSAAQAGPVGAADDANVQRITYGQGEGAQPPPEYPPEAELARQEGTVLVRFFIGEDGHVTAAEAVQPSPYALLNQSAVRTIREEWQFAPGPVREREISIEFRLK
jgi:TonB family protein